MMTYEKFFSKVLSVKLLLSFFILTFFLWSVPIDTKLYEGENTLAYYDQLSKKLADDVPTDDEESERLRNEKALLEKLRTLITKEPQIQTFDTSLLAKDTLSQKEFMTLFNALAAAVDQKDKLEIVQSFTQERLGYLKKTIENITDPQNKNLRLYQLQFAYYKLKQRHDSLSIKNLTPFIAEGEKTLALLLKRVTFDTKAIDINTAKARQQIDTFNKKLIAANLSKERELLSQDEISPKLANTITHLTIEKDEALLKLAEEMLLTGLHAFQSKDFKAVLASKKELTDIQGQLSKNDGKLEAKLSELDTLSKESKEAINYNVLSFKENLLANYEKLSKILSKPFMVIDETPISFWSILQVLGIILLGIIIAKLYFKIFIRLHQKRKVTPAVSHKMIANIGSTLILFAAFVVALGSVGLSITHLAVIAGALSIGVGFALRSIVSNMMAGMVLLSEKYIKIGDYITLKDKQTGKVLDIGFRASVLRTIDNTHMIVPNSDLLDSQVLNLAFEDKIRRIYIPFKVPYGSDIKKISSLVVKAVMESKVKLLRDYPRKKPTVWMTGMGESYIELELLVWIEGLRPSTRSALLIIINDTLRENGIAMPLPQLDVHLNEKKRPKRIASANMTHRVKNEKPISI